jgi:hypothetical protein
MVASTVYNFTDQLRQICATLSGFGYEVWNSHLGTFPVHPGKSNLENCLAAVRHCNAFLGIVRPNYGSGKIGDRSITHDECREAIRLKKPRWFVAHRDVTAARQLLMPYMFRPDGKRTRFKLKRNPIIDDLRVIDLYNDTILSDVKPAKRIGHWTQEYHRLQDLLVYLETQFKDVKHVRKICTDMGSL